MRNALKYTPQDGTVTVEAAVEDEEALVRVRDTGPGIPEVERERLFDRFYRGAGRAQTGGTGIGLALTKALVTLHEGTIEVDSTVGEGSTFAVRWPATLEAPDTSGEEPEAEAGADALLEPVGDRGIPPEEASVAPASPTNGERAPDGSPPTADEAPADRTTVLVVDDNADVRRYVRRLLEPHYRVLEAENGNEGLKRARSALPDLVVADVMMPEMDGFEMVRDLRQSERTDCIPVVMLTARAEEADRVEGLEGGAEAYVTKPFDADVLTAQVDRLIAARRQLRERFQEKEEPEPAGGLGPESPSAEQPDSFRERVRNAIEAHLTDPDFSVSELAEEVGLARRTLTRKVKDEFEQTPNDLIRAARLERGAELLGEDAGTISEVAYAVGFNSLSYFSRRFKEHFGVSPSSYQGKS